MKIAFTADRHLRGKDMHTAWLPQMRAMAEECERRGIRLVLDAGDFFDGKSDIRDRDASASAIIAMAHAGMAEFTRRAVQTVIVNGNHDQSGPATESALRAFDAAPLVRTVLAPEVITFKQSDAADVQVAAVPWHWTGENAEQVISETLAQCDRWAVRVLLAHVQVIGMSYGAACCEAKPGEWQVSRAFMESLERDGVVVRCGDFHRRQPFYVGALKQKDFGECGNPAGFEVLDTETGLSEWVGLDAAPKYLAAEVRDGGTLSVTDALEIARESNGSKKIRLRFDHIPDMVTARKLEESGITVEWEAQREERLVRAEVPEGVLHDPHALLDLYANTQNPPWSEARRAAAHAEYNREHADRASVTAAPDPQAAPVQMAEMEF